MPAAGADDTAAAALFAPLVLHEDGDDANDFLVLDAPPSLKVAHSDACQNDTSPPERHLAARVLDAVRLLQKEEVREEGAGAVAREEYAAEVNVGASTLGHGWCYRSWCPSPRVGSPLLRSRCLQHRHLVEQALQAAAELLRS